MIPNEEVSWFFSLPLFTAVHSSSLCSAVSAAAISCFFSAAVYSRLKKEAKRRGFVKEVRID